MEQMNQEKSLDVMRHTRNTAPARGCGMPGAYLYRIALTGSNRMPIYEYACESCGHRFDKLMKMSDPTPACPECSGAVRKLISASSFVLKGGGWYKDHYGLKGGGSSSGSGESAGSSSSSSESSSSSTSATSSSSGDS